MSTKVVAKQQVPAPERTIADDAMKVMCARDRPGLPKVATLWNLRLVLWDILVPLGLEIRDAGLDLRQRRNTHHNVDDRLRTQMWNSGAPHVFDGNTVAAENSAEQGPLALELARPLRIVGDDEDGFSCQFAWCGLTSLAFRCRGNVTQGPVAQLRVCQKPDGPCGPPVSCKALLCGG